MRLTGVGNEGALVCDGSCAVGLVRPNLLTITDDPRLVGVPGAVRLGVDGVLNIAKWVEIIVPRAEDLFWDVGVVMVVMV